MGIHRNGQSRPAQGQAGSVANDDPVEDGVIHLHPLERVRSRCAVDRRTAVVSSPSVTFSGGNALIRIHIPSSSMQGGVTDLCLAGFELAIMDKGLQLPLDAVVRVFQRQPRASEILVPQRRGYDSLHAVGKAALAPTQRLQGDQGQRIAVRRAEASRPIHDRRRSRRLRQAEPLRGVSDDWCHAPPISSADMPRLQCNKKGSSQFDLVLQLLGELTKIRQREDRLVVSGILRLGSGSGCNGSLNNLVGSVEDAAQQFRLLQGPRPAGEHVFDLDLRVVQDARHLEQSFPMPKRQTNFQYETHD